MQRGRLIAGKYRLESPLARGGMGSVWTARHVLLDAPVAVKFIVASAGGAGRTRFEREAKAAAMLQSPHVVSIYDYGIDDETPYLVMELLEGESLAERLAARKRLPAREAAAIVTQTARALRRASEAAIVHRDLKPSNVFIVRGDEDEGGEIVKVLDFGVVKAPRIALTCESTKTGALVGSPRYMSPEQARASSAVDHRSDLWSLAVIAYRAITGRVPFAGDDIATIVLRIRTERAPPPSQVAPHLGVAFDAFFARALQRDPDERFQTARDLALAFAAAAGEERSPSSTSTSSTSTSSTRAAAPTWSLIEERDVPPSRSDRAMEATRPSGAPAPPRPAPPAVIARTLKSGDPAPPSPVPKPKVETRQGRSDPPTPPPGSLDVPVRAQALPWHQRIRQGLAGAAIASVVVGGAMSAILWRQGAGHEVAVGVASPQPRFEAPVLVTPSVVAPPQPGFEPPVLVTPSCVAPPALAGAPASPALRASAAMPLPSSSAWSERRRRYMPSRP